MNYEIFEHYLTGYCLLRPAFFKKLDLSLIQRPSFKKILELAMTIKHEDNRPISLVALKAMIQESKTLILPSEIDMISDLMTKELVSQDEQHIEHEISNILENLQTRKRRDAMAEIMYKAGNMIKNGKEVEGALLSRTVKLGGAQQLQSTLELMTDSIESTNVFPTGISRIDKNLGGLAKGNMLSLTGDTGSMKTMISLWLCLQILKANPKFTCLYFEKEMPVKDIARRLVAYTLSVPMNDLMSAEKRDSYKNDITGIFEQDEEIKDILSRLRIVPNGNFNNVSDMYRYIDTYRCDVWCLDFLTQLGAEDTSSDFNRFTMAQASMLKNIIADTDTLGIVLNQVKKNSVRARTNKIPQLDDIEWSGAISQYSAYIFSTFYPSAYYQDAPESYFYLYGLKNRHHKPVNIPLLTYPAYCQFSEPTIDELPLMQHWLQGYVTKSQETKKTWRT